MWERRLGGGGCEHRQLTLLALQSKYLQRDGKPGHGACCSSFSVGSPYANLALPPGLGSWPWLHRPWLEEGRGQPPAQTLLVPPEDLAGGRTGPVNPTELGHDHSCSRGLQGPGPWRSSSPCARSARAGCAALGRGGTCPESGAVWPQSCVPGGLTGVVLCWHWAGVGTGRQGEAGGSRTIGSGWPPGWLEGAGAER